MLGNFPLSPRLRTLLLARNRISGIQPALANALPNLTTLVLTENNFVELADLDALGLFRNLTHLVLLGNPVVAKEVGRARGENLWRIMLLIVDGQHYRYWILWRCPSVRFLDYKKVKDVERKKAVELFGTAAEPSALASKVRALDAASS